MKILLAIDDSQCSQDATESIVRQFRNESSEVHVLHAIDWPRLFPPNFSFGEGPEFADEFKEFLANERTRAQSLAEASVARLRNAGFRAASVLREGDAKKAILDYASRWNPDLIVLGSHGRRGLDRIVLGSVSEAVARHAHCSVQIMRSVA